MPRIIGLDTIAEEGLTLLKNAPGIEFEVRTGLKDVAKLREALNQFDGAILRSGVKITAEALERNKRLKAIVRAGVGTDNIDTIAAKRLGIVDEAYASTADAVKAPTSSCCACRSAPAGR